MEAEDKEGNLAESGNTLGLLQIGSYYWLLLHENSTLMELALHNANCMGLSRIFVKPTDKDPRIGYLKSKSEKQVTIGILAGEKQLISER